MEAHTVDPERYSIRGDAAARVNAALDAGRRVIVVGTTTTRALESAAERGGGRVVADAAETSLFIHPGHRFLVAGGLVTNFHLPASSLLMLEKRMRRIMGHQQLWMLEAKLQDQDEQQGLAKKVKSA